MTTKGPWRGGPMDVQLEMLRDETAVHEIPVALGWVGLIGLVLSVANLVARPGQPVWFHVVDLIVATLLLLLWRLVPRWQLTANGLSWVFTFGMLAAVAGLMAQAAAVPSIAPAYTLLIGCALGPIALRWGQWTAGTVGMLALAMAGTWRYPEGQVFDWALVTLGACLTGAVLLHLRLRTLRLAARAVKTMEELATEDPLTGLLNRRGLLQAAAGLGGSAERLGLPVSAVFVDVDGLKSANDRHGHEFGDQILRAVATALRSATREGDLLARWGGDEFVVLALGEAPDEELFEDRIAAAVGDGNLDLTRWPGRVSVGCAMEQGGHSVVQPLVARADARMYERRRRLRPDLPGLS